MPDRTTPSATNNQCTPWCRGHTDVGDEDCRAVIGRDGIGGQQMSISLHQFPTGPEISVRVTGEVGLWLDPEQALVYADHAQYAYGRPGVADLVRRAAEIACEGAA